MHSPSNSPIGPDHEAAALDLDHVAAVAITIVAEEARRGREVARGVGEDRGVDLGRMSGGGAGARGLGPIVVVAAMTGGAE